MLLDYSYLWREIFVVSSDRDVITVRYAGHSESWDEEQPRSKCVIKQQTLKLLSRPQAAKKFADNLLTDFDRISARIEAQHKDQDRIIAAHRKAAGHGATALAPVQTGAYAITIPLPKDARLLPVDLEVEPGTALAACWANKWQPLTVIRQNDDGTVRVRWNEWSSGFDSDLPRDQLIIEKKVARQLRRKTPAATEDLTRVLRTWTNITGKHKIEAYFVRKTDTEVTLKTDTGRELTLPIEKLSDKDRALISKPAGEDDNPFK